MLFSELPLEINHEILNFLTIKELEQIAVVSTQFKSASDQAIAQRTPEELQAHLTQLQNYLNNRIESFKTKLSAAEAEKAVIANINASPASVNFMLFTKGISLIVPVIDIYLHAKNVFNLVQGKSSAADFLVEAIIDTAIGALEIPIVLAAKKATASVEIYDKKRKQAFEKVDRCNTDLEQERTNAQLRIHHFRQKMTMFGKSTSKNTAVNTAFDAGKQQDKPFNFDMV